MAEKIIKACAASIFGLLFFVSQVQARPFDDVIDSGYITIFVYKDYAPYSWKTEDGDLKGIDVEVAQKFAEALGVELRFLVRGADENIDDDLRINIWKGDLIHRRVADVMMHAPYDREVDTRNELAVLMGPYFLEHMALVVNEEKLPVVENFARFMNQPIAVELDTAGDFFLSNAFRGALQQSIRRGRTFADVVEHYRHGEVAAAMGSLAQAEWIALQATAIDSYIARPPMPGIVRRNWPVGFAVKHDSRDLGYALSDVATQLMTSGELAKITEKYGVTYYAPE